MNARQLFFTFGLTIALAAGRTLDASEVSGMDESIAKLKAEMAQNLAPEDGSRLARGLMQVARFWRADDGDAAAFEGFVRRQFAAGAPARDALLDRFERLFEQIDGHMTELTRELKVQADLDQGPILPVDELFAGYDPGAHLGDDAFANKLAFVVLLNFPLTTLDERLTQGESWTRRQWAEARLAQHFARRVPAEVSLELARVSAALDQYVAEYNIWAHHLVDASGQRFFPAGMKLLSHWNLRDEVKAQYAERAAGLKRQRLLQQVMERIVTQTIPAVVVDNPGVDWDPVANVVRPAADKDAESPRPLTGELTNAPEADTRYAMIEKAFEAARRIDPYSPTAPTHIARTFDESNEIPEPRVRAMLEQVLSSPLLARVARLIEARLGRKLEPFDIWYDGFMPRGRYPQAELDAICRKRYPTAQAFEADIPNILVKLGFPPDRAKTIAAHIAVDPARGSGHALGAAMRTAKARLRTRVGPDGMDYKGFNIALHELGHNVEQTISLNDVDHTLLAGVPNTAFTEAFAFVFQARDLEVLGLGGPDAGTQALLALNDYWMTCEIAAVALVDMRVWHWMYDHPQATPAELKQATLAIARDVWNRYYAPIFGRKDVELFAIYAHMISNFLYLPNYPIGHLISFQIDERMRRAGSVGTEFDRMARVGRVAPDLWMKQAVGNAVGPEALLAGAERALAEVKTAKR
jgi:hypothetical protein